MPLAAAVGLAASASPAHPATSGAGWRTVATVAAPAETGLYSVAPAGPERAWAVGVAVPASASKIRPLIESWNGTTWSRVHLPAGLVPKLGQEPQLTTAAASGRNGLWAFTEFGGWLHESGTTWTAGRLPGNRFLQASVMAGTAVWAFGAVPTASGGASPYAARLTGGRWQRTAVPGKGAIAAASAVSANDIWAVLGRGLFGTTVSVAGPGGLVHWTGSQWRKVPGLPAVLRNSALGAVLAISDDNVWVGGATRNSAKGSTETVGHRNGRHWTVTTLHAPATRARYHIASMAPDGKGGVWAIGLFVDRLSGQRRTAFRLWHQTGGRWRGPVHPKLGTSGNALIGLASVGRSVWAAGATGLGNPSRAVGIVALWGPVP